MSLALQTFFWTQKEVFQRICWSVFSMQLQWTRPGDVMFIWLVHNIPNLLISCYFSGWVTDQKVCHYSLKNVTSSSKVYERVMFFYSLTNHSDKLWTQKSDITISSIFFFLWWTISLMDIGHLYWYKIMIIIFWWLKLNESFLQGLIAQWVRLFPSHVIQALIVIRLACTLL